MIELSVKKSIAYWRVLIAFSKMLGFEYCRRRHLLLLRRVKREQKSQMPSSELNEEEQAELEKLLHHSVFLPPVNKNHNEVRFFKIAPTG